MKYIFPSKFPNYLITILCFLYIFSFSSEAQSCVCYDFIYLNDTGGPENKVKKFKVDATGVLTEIGNPWLLANGIVDQPHGIAADLNGFLYIGERDTQNGEYNIQKFTCDAEKVDADLSTITIDNFTDDGYSYSHFSIGNYLYANIYYDEFNSYNEIRIYDLCSGDLIGCQSPAALWGFVAGTDGYWYGTGWTPLDDQGNWGPGIVRGSLDPATFTDGAGGCGDALESYLTADALGIPANSQAQGIAQDDFGNLYISVSAGGGFSPPSYILKIRPDGSTISSLIDTAVEADSTDNLNWGGARGLVWSQSSNMIYVSTVDDCIAAFDTALNYIPESSVHPPGVFPKQMGILTECCPFPSEITIDTLLCNLTYPVDIFLQDFMNCDGVICEGKWNPNMENIGIDFNDCDNSIRINGDQACGTFTLFSDGSNALSQCGQFSVTLNIETATIAAATVTGDQTICEGDVPQALKATSSFIDMNYQWQMSTTSCTDGFMDIAGATSDTYTPPTLSTTTYYRVISSKGGNCTTGLCEEISNCVTVMTEPCCPPQICLPVTVIKN